MIDPKYAFVFSELSIWLPKQKPCHVAMIFGVLFIGDKRVMYMQNQEIKWFIWKPVKHL